jgi:hypothetical protein
MKVGDLVLVRDQYSRNRLVKGFSTWPEEYGRRTMTSVTPSIGVLMESKSSRYARVLVGERPLWFDVYDLEVI